jgi:predicted transcriptional regulator
MANRTTTPLLVRLDQTQRDALDRVAKERNVPRSVLLRDAVAEITGVADPVKRQQRRRKRKT